MTGWVQWMASGEVLKEALITSIVIVASWFAAQVYVFVVDHVARRWAARTASRLDDEILSVVRRPGFVLIVLTGIYIAIHRYQFRLRGFLDGLLFVISVAIIVFTVIGVLGVLLGWWGDRMIRERPGETVARDLLPLADKFNKIILVVIGTIIVLDHFAIDVKSILVTLGVGSLAIGLALQDTLANMFGGFTIMMDRPFRVGDRIRLQTGETGDVKAVGIRSTAVSMLDGNLLIVPNALLVKNSIVNLSYPDSRAQVVIEIGVAYGTDPSRVKQILLESARQQPDVLGEPGPSVFFEAFGDYALTFLMVCYVGSFRNVLVATDAINSTLDARFRKEGIVMPYPTRTVEVLRSAGTAGGRV